MLNDLHSDAAMLLINRGLLARNAEMEANIGRTIRYIAWTPAMGTLARDNTFRIVGVQKVHDGRIAYRVVCDAIGDTFGRPAIPEEIEFC